MPHFFNCSGPATAAAPAAAQSQSISAPVAFLPDTFPINSGSSATTTADAPKNALAFASLGSVSPTASFSSIQDNHGNNYNFVGTSDGSNGLQGIMWLVLPALLPSGSTITATTSDASQWGDGEGFYAVGAMGGIDTHVSHNDDTVNGTTSLSLSTGTLAENVEIVVGVFNTNGNAVTWSEDPHFTTIHNDNNNITSYRIVSSNASVTWNPTFTATGPFNAVLAAFKA